MLSSQSPEPVASPRAHPRRSRAPSLPSCTVISLP
ncbi:WAT1-related protein [Psidium guajava]|nr:WAT1-related protein [Psidium guajava]